MMPHILLYVVRLVFNIMYISFNLVSWNLCGPSSGPCSLCKAFVNCVMDYRSFKRHYLLQTHRLWRSNLVWKAVFSSPSQTRV